ncbi:MAG: HD domain-containing phosphohydrolase [Actinomycetota bacterium]
MERLRLADILSGLSIVADLGYALPPESAMRSCLIATSLARMLGLSQQEAADTFYSALLLHVGCLTFAHELSAAFADDRQANAAGARTNFAHPRDIFATLIPGTTRGMKAGARLKATAFVITRGRSFGRRFDTSNCEVARETARRIGLADSVQRSLYHVHEWWDGRGVPSGLKGDQIPISSRIARLATDADLFQGLGGVELAVDALKQRAGTILDPSIVDLFEANSRHILEEDAAGDPRNRVLEVEPGPVVEIDELELPTLATAFADLADMKTPFTHGHSREVARLAQGAALTMGFDAADVARTNLAALLHDLGRAAVSDAVWEKPGPLSSAEWEQVRMHAYHSERILATSRTLEPLAKIVGMHHERTDGSGYHRGARARELPIPSRVIACADAFQAMTQTRPHRRARKPAEAADELVREARSGKLDAKAVDAVIAVAGQPRVGRRRTNPAGLSEREIDVLRLVAEGRSNGEIADRLHVSRRTAEHHVQHIYTKIGVSSRAAAALFALEHELLPPAD